MKSFRTLVLLLLVLLLPLRGAVAATMLCGTAGAALQATSALHDHGDHAAHGGHAMHADAGAHDHGGSAGHEGNNGHADSCNLCASGCHATPLTAAPPEVLAPHQTARLVYPTLSVAATAFHSDAQERPPRSI